MVTAIQGLSAAYYTVKDVQRRRPFIRYLYTTLRLARATELSDTAALQIIYAKMDGAIRIHINPPTTLAAFVRLLEECKHTIFEFFKHSNMRPPALPAPAPAEFTLVKLAAAEIAPPDLAPVESAPEPVPGIVKAAAKTGLGKG